MTFPDDMPDWQIEQAAKDLVRDFTRIFEPLASPIMPVEEILECHLGLTLHFEDLAERYGSTGILGATFIKDRRVVIDASLDPDEHPEMEGRYRFTLAHEIGHWMLHVPQILVLHDHPSLFDEALGFDPIICRTASKREPIEVQADLFASYLLMPEATVRQAWTDTFSVASTPINILDEVEQLRKELEFDFGKAGPACNDARELASQFKVSGQAMQIRLIGLGYLTKTQPAEEVLVLS